jgi:hypothetical protein
MTIQLEQGIPVLARLLVGVNPAGHPTVAIGGFSTPGPGRAASDAGQLRAGTSPAPASIMRAAACGLVAILLCVSACAPVEDELAELPVTDGKADGASPWSTWTLTPAHPRQSFVFTCDRSPTCAAQLVMRVQPEARFSGFLKTVLESHAIQQRTIIMANVECPGGEPTSAANIASLSAAVEDGELVWRGSWNEGLTGPLARTGLVRGPGPRLCNAWVSLTTEVADASWFESLDVEVVAVLED